MPKASQDQSNAKLLAAKGIADAVLIRLSNGHSHVVLLANDVIYDRAGEIHLQRVRWMCSASDVGTPTRRVLTDGFLEELRLQKSEISAAVVLPELPCVRVGMNPIEYSWVKLLAAQYGRLNAIKPNNFITSGMVLTAPSPPRAAPEGAAVKAPGAVSMLRHAIFIAIRTFKGVFVRA